MKQFQAESKRLLDLMINSIYTHKEIFMRELISNASDAIDKLYYKSLQEDDTGLSRDDFAIQLTLDKENRKIVIEDNGCGMTKEELEKNLGTIAKSGSLSFKQENEKKENIDIIGQFGVGFYAAFMVAKHVTVESKAYGSDEAWCWQSSGAEGYTVDTCEKDSHGTKITLEVKDNTNDDNYDTYLDQYTIQNLVKKYSDYIRYPIRMEMHKSRQKPKPENAPEDYKPEYEDYTENETLNSMVPLWRKNKNEIKEDEYNDFYKSKFGDYENPLKVIHSSTEGVSTYNALLFIPSHASYDYYTKDFEKGLQLYSNGVLIMDKCADLLPDYFSFVRGLVDSQDLNLNISREMLQHDRQLHIIAGRLEKKIKSELESMLKNDREKYEQFFKAFGLQLKYGVYSDFGQHKDLLQDLLLFHSSKEKKLVTLKEYVEGMKEEQKFIYYAAGESVSKIDMLPQTEALKDKGYEILYLTDNVDEFALRIMHSYSEKEFKSVSDDDLGLETEEEKEAAKKKVEENKDMLNFMKDSLNGQVKQVILSTKLKSHPVCLSTDGALSIEMEKVLNAMPNGNEEQVKAQRVLEINANHPIFQKLTALYKLDQEKLKQYTNLLYTQALLIEGVSIDDPVAFSNQICKLMVED
ncbi:molecular chaperone HtpG [Caproicibacterium amylolyticum]|jgi:molecular chaperone HtpG|uniref:Chaperone protein HtpG n=1 Tax=Caproicibacterium amylolyticum TaxID=2766537 RepID=A0A7G9WIZ4_9FIRM|nr:molecular chaperone HtpG [Caproicibacterium amylolyticum]MBE6721651.1 molecular chaperone HtpG [Oscillospiraceae bacterium]QNO18656.1 molecular chaperone HtpG [Caproicibacterium amylolyticum]